MVIESTGLFTKRPDAEKHLAAGARKVIISAPASDPDATIALGVNDATYDPAKHHILSNASCTTNCLAPVAKVLLEQFGLKRAWMTTTHAYTNDQRILDLPHSDLRRARAAAVSLIPTSTGAARAVGLVLPELEGKLDGIAIRVPTSDVSIVDLVGEVERDASGDQINEAFRKAAEGPMAGILDVTDEPLVSIDYRGNPHSSDRRRPQHEGARREPRQSARLVRQRVGVRQPRRRSRQAGRKLAVSASGGAALPSLPRVTDLDVAGRRVLLRSDLNVPLRDGNSRSRQRPAPAAAPGRAPARAARSRCHPAPRSSE